MRQEVNETFRAIIASGAKLIGAAVGSGMAARHLLAGGADFVLIASGGQIGRAHV
jgi:predicted TIM-barrel enzyme